MGRSQRYPGKAPHQGAQRDEQHRAQQNFHFRGLGQVRDSEQPSPCHISRERSKPAGRQNSHRGAQISESVNTQKASMQQRRSLIDRMTRDDGLHQEARGSNQSPQPGPVTGKRGRSEEEDHEPSKRSRLTPENRRQTVSQAMSKQSGPHTATNHKVEKNNTNRIPLTKKSEEERRAARAKRFAPRQEPIDPAAEKGNISKKNAQEPTKTREHKGDGTPAKAITTNNVVTKEQKRSPLTLPPLPSPSSSKDDSPTSKRPREEPEEPENRLSKKPKTKICINKLNVLKAALKKNLRKPRAITSAPVEPNHEYQVDYIEYDDRSVPVLHSAGIEHKGSEKLPNDPTWELQQEAIAFSKRPWTSSDLGRTNVPKVGPARVIEDCDLYLYEGRIHVATERGLLLAGDYLKLIGVPDEQGVRFGGKKPSWMVESEAKHHRRRVLAAYEPTSPMEKEGGFIEIHPGSLVVVYGCDQDGFAWGRRLADDVEGWFPYDHTCRMDWGQDPPADGDARRVPDPDVIDWATFDYSGILKAQKASQAEPKKDNLAAESKVALLAVDKKIVEDVAPKADVPVVKHDLPPLPPLPTTVYDGPTYTYDRLVEDLVDWSDSEL